MEDMKKKILALTMVALFASITVSGTIAYFTAEDYAHNVITTGGVGIELIEKTKDPNGAEVDFPEEGVDGVMPGTSVSKIVKVKNNGESDAWIRIEMEFNIVDASGNPLPLNIDGEDIMNVDILDGWIDGGDGYYYYEKVVAPEEFTDLFIKEVEFSPAMGNEYQNCTASLIISAQAVQIANNGDNVMDAKGWPEK